MTVSFVDFIPRLLEKEVPFSTLSLTSGVAGPQYQDFDMLVRRANDWLSNHSSFHLIGCEELDVAGVFDFCSDFRSDPADGGPDSIAAYLRVLRVWVKDLGSSCSNGRPGRIEYINVMPSRLESTPRAFAPRFQILRDAILSFNDRVSQGYENISGRLLNVGTSTLRFTSRHCGLDPRRTFWMAADSGDVHLCFFFRLFFQKDKSIHYDAEIDFKDFAPNYSLQGKHRVVQSETFASLTERAAHWFESCDVTVLNLQTVDSPSYYKCWRDSNGQESRALDRPHTVLSRGTVTYHTKVLRVYYTRSPQTQSQHSEQQVGPRMKLGHKTFHMPIWNRVLDIRLSSEVIDDPALRYRGEALYRVSSWMQLCGLKMVGMETVVIHCLRPKSAVSAENTHFQSPAEIHGSCAFHALRIYVDLNSGPDNNRSIDLSPQPKNITVSKSACEIM